MKRSLIIILTAYITFLSACYKDKGNYDYHDINEVKISGLAASYTYVLGTTLHIEPKIQMTQQDLDTSAVNCYWILTKGDTPLDTLGTSAVLDVRMNVKTDNYVIWLRVVDKASGVAYKATTNVTVSTLYSIGILLAGTDDNGNAEAEMISTVKDTLIFRNILSTSGLPTLRDPLSFVFHGGKDTNSNNARLWIMTKSGSYYLDRLTMAGSTSRKFANICITNENVNKETLTPILAMPQVRDKAGNAGGSSNTWARAIMTSDGDIYATHSLLNGGDYYSTPINRATTNYDKKLKAAPYFFYAIANTGAVPAMMWFDADNQRFMVYATFGSTLASTIPADGATDIFAWNLASQNRTLVYGENTRNTDNNSTNGNSFAIVKDNAGQHYIYKFYATGAAPIKRDLYTVSSIATDFDKASFYAFSSKRTVVFYTVGNKLYAYDYNKGLEKSYQFPELSSDEITMLKFDTQIDFATNSLYIATYNSGTKGRLRRFNVGNNPNIVDLIPVDGSDWNGMIKIKDINWRGLN